MTAMGIDALAETAPRNRIVPGPNFALDMLEHSQFEPHVGTRFRLHAGDGSIQELELVEVSAHSASGAPAQASIRTPFSMMFRGPSGPPCPQKIYKLEHAALGALEIFLVPLGPDDHGQRYEAVFN